MNLKSLTEKLIEAKTESERQSLLKAVTSNDWQKLAIAIKVICYSFWTSEPVKAQNSAKALRSLFKLSRCEVIKAYSDWINGIAEITRGNLISAIKSLDSSAAVFTHLEKEHEAAQTQVAKLYALALLGNYQEATVTGNEALKIFEKHGDQLAAGKVEKNLGNIFSRYELHAQAEKFYLSAYEKFVKLDNLEELSMVENGLAITYSALNDFRKAEKFYTQALNRARESKKLLTQAEIEASMGNLALFRGKLDQALKFSELSRRNYEILQMPHQTAIAKLEIADIYLELNLTTEAFSIYETLVKELHNLKLQGEEARARANYGRAATVLNKIPAARKELRKAARLYVLENNQVGAVAVKLNEAKLELDLGNYRKVIKRTEEAEFFLYQSDNTRYLLTAQWLKAEALRNLGELEEAQKLLTQTFAQSIKQEQPRLAQSAQISLGKLAAANNDYKKAKKHFQKAIYLIEALRAPLASEEFRMAFLANKLHPYEELAKTYLAEKKYKKAFLMIEKARSRSLAETLDEQQQVQAEDNGQNKLSDKLHKELNILREELNWFYSQIQRAKNTEIKKLQWEAKSREKQIANVQRQIASTDESKTGKRNSLDFEHLQKQIGENRAILEYINFDGNLSAFLITDKKVHFFENLAKESEVFASHEGLQFQFGGLRYGSKTLESFMPELKKRAQFYLQKLFEELLGPLESVLGNRDLTIVPVGALHYVPFHALFDGTQYQVEIREIVYAPSATVWQFLASKPEQKLKNALLIGFADERIPFVENEIENLKLIFPQSKSFVGEQAVFAAFTENAPQFDVLHLACHGQFRPENPLFSSLHLADGFVTVRDICSQKIKAEIVTLSACETGLNKIFAGDEILGLARGFLSAGAKSLILSLWTVNDEATTNLMIDFYAELKAGKAASKALKIAQCRFIERGIHPYFWSPFALIGR